MVEDLGADRQSASSREASTHDAEVERRDHETGEGAASRAADADPLEDEAQPNESAR